MTSRLRKVGSPSHSSRIRRAIRSAVAARVAVAFASFTDLLDLQARSLDERDQAVMLGFLHAVEEALRQPDTS